MISWSRAAWAVLVLAVGAALVIGCGDVFRPTINFVPGQGGTPATVANAVILSTNPSGNGSNTHIDVAGDTAVGVINVGANPVFLGKGGINNNSAFVINSDNTVSSYTALFAQPGILFPVLPTPTQTSLPPGATGAIGGAASNNGTIYIAEQGPCVTAPPSANGCVAVILNGGSVATQTVPAGKQPVMVATNSGSTKAYVINRGSNNVTVIGTQDNSVIATIPVGAQPTWGVMSGDAVDVFVVNQGDGTVSVIDTTLDIAFTTIDLNGPPGTGTTSTTLLPNFAFYDNVHRRVYVTNPGDNSVTIIKADSINLGANPQVLPKFLGKVTVSGSPISVGAIADGTRAYAALANCAPVAGGINHTNLLANLSSCTGNSVSVIDVSALTESKVIPVGTGPVSLAVSRDGSKVYTANAIDQNISIIKTSTDAEVMRKPAPQQSLGCPTSCTVTGVQTPFMVVTFP